MGISREVRNALLIALASAADLMLLAIWATRPPRIYTEWLRLGPTAGAPIETFETWTNGRMAPWTPLGLLSSFELLDLLVGAALIFALAVLLTLLTLTWRGRSLPHQAGGQRRIPWPPSVHFRVRAVLVAVAIVGLELGWEVNGWQTWRLRERYLNKLHSFSEREADDRKSVQRLRKAIEQLESPTWPVPDEFLTEAAIRADRAELLDRSKRDLAYSETMADLHSRLVRKYTLAAAHPRVQVAPDPPLPEPEPDRHFWLGRREYRQALNAFDEAIRRYPGLWDAHRRRAWILATCVDPRLRDGKSAVESAALACELTKWRNPLALDTLAAAHAEAGDLKAAIEWQSKALEHMWARFPRSKEFKDRLALYQAGTPYHEKK